MYQSRLHATNGIISIAVDALSGEVLEFTRESTWDNAAKNHVQQAWPLFDGVVHTADGDRYLHPPRYLDIRADGRLTPAIRVEQRACSATVRMDFPHLVLSAVPGQRGETADMGASIIIELPENDCRTRWRMTLTNATQDEVGTVHFPALDGLWLGETWADDVLVLPRFAGWQVVNPTQKLAAPMQRITWKWQEYLYPYLLNEMCGTEDARGAHVKHLPYSGECSMLWMDVYDPTERTGIYMTCRTSGTHMMGLRVESFGEECPGVGLAITHEPCLERGTWESESCVVAFHEGDWHWAADEYRAWFEGVHVPIPQTHRPDWFMESAGLMAHYDFQYQGGGIVHRYRDIPHLLEMAQEMGFNHLLLSGWNRDGFDFGFPHYTVNPNLGTEQELRDALAEVKQKGGHVAFYVNSRLCNTGFEDEQERLERCAVRRRDGSRFEEKYGADDVTFASLCINSAWREDLRATVRYLTQVIGADSIYLDQLAMACAAKCYNEAHEHGRDRACWNAGYSRLIRDIQADAGPGGVALLFEGCNDVFGPGASAQLVTTMGGPFLGRLPEVYRYTFPGQVLTDMMNPRRNSGMRPEHVARHSTEFLCKAFVCGMYFWCYDLEWDNTWRRDPEQLSRLKQLVALRVQWLRRYGMGRFRDTVGILRAPAEQMVKRYDLADGALLAAANDAGPLHGEVTLRWDRPDARCEMLACGAEGEPAELPCTVGDGCVTFILPECEAAVVVVR